jgi:endonuclease/exonuclease/phosphatase family metal-dependent hydrolase
MKIITLNTWGGRAGKTQLLEFFAKHKDADIFCLQEVWAAPYEHLDGHPAGGLNIKHDDIMVYGLRDISELLDTHVAYFKPHHLDHYGLLIMVKKEFAVVEEGDIFVYKERGYIPEGDVGNHARNLQYVTVRTETGDRTIMNFHGLWNGMGKGDSEDRLLQSDRIVQFLKTKTHPVVLCGDFNLLPTTESLKRFEDFGLRNLIHEFGITSTRTSFYTKPEKFADYAFVSSDVDVRSFQVLPDEVSDHAALELVIE